MAEDLLLLEDGSTFLELQDSTNTLQLEGIGEIPSSVGGGAGVPHAFTRKRWRELQALIAAEEAARAKAARFTKPEKQEALLEVAEAAAAAIQAAELEGFNKRLDALLVRNADAIRAAIRATNQVKLLKETAHAIELSRIIAARLAEEADNEMIRLLLLS